MCESAMREMRGCWRVGVVIATIVGTSFATACGGNRSDSAEQAPVEADVAQAATACADARTSTMYLTGRANEYQYETDISYSGVITTLPRQPVRENVNTGYAAVTVTGCKDPVTGKWSALSYSVEQLLTQRDLDLNIARDQVTPRPHEGDRGFGVFVKRTTADRVEISSVVCREKPAPITWLGVAKFVTGLPIFKSNALGIGMWVFNVSLPEGPDATYPCGELGSESIPWSFTDDGVAQLHVPGHYLHYGSATWEGGCPALRYCGFTHEQGIEVLQGQ
ncbi:MAG TPA: hypothetical protein VJ787_11270 [Thermoleophilia bacterium]|nr:hypothetical protein [Thermoleophilia bacterium]